AFPEYKAALSGYDFSERLSKPYKNDYAAYARQQEAVRLLRDALNTGQCEAEFLDAASGASKPISPVMAAKTLKFDVAGDAICYMGDRGFLSISSASLHKALTNERAELPAVISPAKKPSITPLAGEG